MINQNTYNIVANNPALGEASEKFIRKPLRSGIKEIEVKTDREEISAIDKSDADSFQKIDFRTQLHEYVSETYLKIIKPVLDGNSKWTFDMGSGPFQAEIEDVEFLVKVRDGVYKFGNGDYLRVLMKSTQRQNGKKFSAENVIQQVLEKTTLENDQLEFLPNI